MNKRIIIEAVKCEKQMSCKGCFLHGNASCGDVEELLCCKDLPYCAEGYVYKIKPAPDFGTLKDKFELHKASLIDCIEKNGTKAYNENVLASLAMLEGFIRGME